MKKYMITALAITCSSMLFSCKYMSKEPSHEVNEANNLVLQDSLNKLYPSLAAGYVGAAVEDFKDVTVNLGDKQLYNSSDEQLQQVAQNVGRLVYKIYDANNYLGKGTLIITESETKLPSADMPKKTFDLHLADIIKANEK